MSKHDNAYIPITVGLDYGGDGNSYVYCGPVKKPVPDDFGYPEKYPMPNLAQIKARIKAGKRPLESVSFLPLEDGRVMVYPPNRDPVVFPDRDIAKAVLAAAGYDMADFDKYLPPPVSLEQVAKHVLGKADDMAMAVAAAQHASSGRSTLPVKLPVDIAGDFYNQFFPPGENQGQAQTQAAPIKHQGVRLQTPEAWWADTLARAKSSRPSGHVDEAFKLANELLKMSALDRHELLDYLCKQKDGIGQTVKACLAQLQAGVYYEGMPPPEVKEDSSTVVLTDSMLVAVLGRIKKYIYDHHELCMRVMRDARIARNGYSDESTLMSIAIAIDYYLADKSPLGRESVEFISAFLNTVHAAGGPRPGLPAPDAIIEAMSRKEREAAAQAERAREAEIKEEFHARFKRGTRKIRVVKTRNPLPKLDTADRISPVPDVAP